jgi:hypothetical protein
MNLYLDTEFTQFQNPKLISIALISDDAKHLFYAELTDTYKMSDCSDFVIETVLPLLDAPEFSKPLNAEGFYDKMTLKQCRKYLAAWLAKIDSKVRIYTDAPCYDFTLLKSIFKENQWPQNVDPAPHTPAVGACEWMRFDARYERAFDLNKNLRRHHALDDAIALAEATMST